MSLSSRASGAIAGALAIALTAGGIAIAATAAASRSAGTASAPPLTSIRPGPPLKTGRGAAAPAGTAGSFSTVARESSNWAGFAVSQGTTTFRYVSATFYVPRLDCSGVSADNPTFSSHWVGLDGWRQNSTTVEQTGVLAACYPDSSNVVVPMYAAWWEMFPNLPSYPAVTIHGGDRITASVYYNKSTRKFELTLTDNSTGKGFSRTESCPSGFTCRRLSAEAISEAPSDATTGATLPLADYQGATFANVAITNTSGTHKGGISSNYWTDFRISQISDGTNTDASGNAIPAGTLLAKPTSLISSKTFDNYWIPGT
ncbi:MAG: hypothetical protein J2P35_12625 [Actinobacteria bacterium]|nr:hypothetical protein [Actinomycetota bacterium]MBO0785147.1 hypothetical protein [Actinomycetota bacterium]